MAEDAPNSLERRIEKLESRQQEIRQALWGNVEIGQLGYVKDMDTRLRELSDDIREARDICESIRDERREEAAERRGMKRIVGYTGISNFVTLLTVIALLYSLWRGVGGV